MLNQTRSFNLTGFLVGHEVVMQLLVVEYDTDQDGWIYMKVKDNSGNIIYSSSYYMSAEPGGLTYQRYMWLAIGVRPEPYDEIFYNGTYIAEVTGLVTSYFTFTVSNLSAEAMSRHAGHQGHIWVEGNYLCFISQIGGKQMIYGYPSVTYVGTDHTGHIWVSDDEYRLYWVDTSGYVRFSKLADHYFFESGDSGPSGGASTANVGVGNKGKIWVDLYEWTYIKFIAWNGQKCRISNGSTFEDYQ